MPKITRSTLKSFINRNRDKLYVKTKSRFDGMCDGIETVNGQFKPATQARFADNTYGVEGVWIVGGGRDYIKDYTDDQFTGYEVSNCCGSFIVGVKHG